MFLFTDHGSVLAFDTKSQIIRHVPLNNAELHLPIVIPNYGSQTVIGGPLDGVIIEEWQQGVFTLRRGNRYLCAEANSNTVTWDRTKVDAWEKFYLLLPFSEAFNEHVSSLLFSGLKLYQLGKLAAAERELFRVLNFDSKNVTATYYHRLIQDLLYLTKNESKLTQLWRINAEDMHGLFETQWLSYLFQDLRFNKVGLEPLIPSECLVVIDRKLDRQSSTFYKDAFKSGARICLIHLSDEAYNDNTESYQWCDVVWRNYWSPILARIQNVNFFPLGYKSGFVKGSIENFSERLYSWSFAGDVKKSTRQHMLKSMSEVANGYVHTTSAFASKDGLSVDRYQQLLTQSLFVPCPAGNANLESFRISEALEAGCIPIVERRPGFDYFSLFFGKHPFPTIDDWSFAPELVKGILQSGNSEVLRLNCVKWWESYKANLRKAMVKSVENMSESRF